MCGVELKEHHGAQQRPKIKVRVMRQEPSQVVLAEIVLRWADHSQVEKKTGGGIHRLVARGPLKAHQVMVSSEEGA